MWTARRLIVAGITTFILGLIITFPARVAYRWFAPEQLRISGISGSVWRGNAANVDAGGISFANVRWSLRPLALLTGKLEVTTSSSPASGFLDADIAIDLGGNVTLSNVAGAVTLGALAGVLPLNGVEGDVSLQFEELVIRNGWPVEANGTLGVSSVVSRYLSPAPLGDYQAHFQTVDVGILGTVEAMRGALDLAGTIRLSANRNYEFAGRVAARPNAPPEIEQQLQYLGTPDSGGMREFRIEGRL